MAGSGQDPHELGEGTHHPIRVRHATGSRSGLVRERNRPVGLAHAGQDLHKLGEGACPLKWVRNGTGRGDCLFGVSGRSQIPRELGKSPPSPNRVRDGTGRRGGLVGLAGIG